MYQGNYQKNSIKEILQKPAVIFVSFSPTRRHAERLCMFNFWWQYNPLAKNYYTKFKKNRTVSYKFKCTFLPKFSAITQKTITTTKGTYRYD